MFAFKCWLLLQLASSGHQEPETEASSGSTVRLVRLASFFNYYLVILSGQGRQAPCKDLGRDVDRTQCRDWLVGARKTSSLTSCASDVMAQRSSLYALRRPPKAQSALAGRYHLGRE